MRNAKVNTYTTAALILPNNIALELPVLDPYDNGIIEDTALWEPDEHILMYAVHDDDPIEFEWGEGYWTGCELVDVSREFELNDNEYWVRYDSHGPYGHYTLTDEPSTHIIRILDSSIPDPLEHVVDVIQLYSAWANGETYRVVRCEYSSSYKLVDHDVVCGDVIGNDNIDGEIIAEMAYG